RSTSPMVPIPCYNRAIKGKGYSMRVDLTSLHSFRLPATAADLLQITSADDLQLLKTLDNYLILAAGSNTVFVDDYDGTVVQPQFFGMDVSSDSQAYYVSCGASENWHQFVLFCMAQQIFGLENLALIPGTVGAAPVQNIGAYGVEVADYIESVDCYHLSSGKLQRLTQRECQFNYRDSLFKRESGDWLITRVNFKLNKDWRPNTEYPVFSSITSSASPNEILNHVIAVRQAKLPNPDVLPNAGSFFKNPVVDRATLNRLQKTWPNLVYFQSSAGIKLAAGWLIDTLGLKGCAEGGAAVHKQQALVLVNCGNASGSDVIRLCHRIQSRVYETSGVLLEPEVRLIGRHGLIKEFY
ncbi:MAG: UDP-N-acetylmuramate dehydrogenase, partial [Pseudomonadota bacterium]